jgi:hypothetical protein
LISFDDWDNDVTVELVVLFVELVIRVFIFVLADGVFEPKDDFDEEIELIFRVDTKLFTFLSTSTCANEFSCRNALPGPLFDFLLAMKYQNLRKSTRRTRNHAMRPSYFNFFSRRFGRGI